MENGFEIGETVLVVDGWNRRQVGLRGRVLSVQWYQERGIYEVELHGGERDYFQAPDLDREGVLWNFEEVGDWSDGHERTPEEHPRPESQAPGDSSDLK